MSLLFEKGNIGSLILKNRIVKSATLENMANSDGLPTDDTLNFYESLASGGSGLIITGYAYVNKNGKSFLFQNGCHNDDIIPEWQRIIDVVHKNGAKIAMEIVHGGRQINSRLFKRKPMAASRFPNFFYFSISLSMTEKEIEQTIEDFGKAASRAKKAGFDAVQIHAAHGYLIANFLSPLTNRRSDKWGKDRFLFLEKVYMAIREAVGKNFPILCKLNVDDFVGFGITERCSFLYAKRLEELELDGLEISGGILETTFNMSMGEIPVDIMCRNRGMLEKIYLTTFLNIQKLWTGFKEAYFLEYAKRLKPSLKIPLILVGGIRKKKTAETILENKHSDFVSMARALICEPDLPKKWEENTQDSARCLSCNLCIGEVEQGNKTKCYKFWQNN
ncbi:MAG: NADH:flavin oxidoreductase [bacterium]